MTHPELVRNLVKPGYKIREEMLPSQAHLLHMAVGVSGEAGELLDAIKKWTIYQNDLDVLNVIEELGDLEFYMEGIRQALFLSREIILEQNISKLTKRYSKGTFTNADAISRADKTTEQQKPLPDSVHFVGGSHLVDQPQQPLPELPLDDSHT